MIRALVILVCSVAPTGAVADPQPQRIEEAFSHDQIDRTLWMTERLGARVDPGGGQLKIIVPKGPPGRPPAGLKSKFRMEGDFDARAEYRIASWRRPKKQSINVEIVVEGPGGAASVIRTNHAEVGSGNSFWYGPADSKRQGAWKQVSTKDTSGWLRLKRSGGELQFFVSGPGAANFRQLGAVDYGTAPITSLSFRVSVPETESAVQVAFGKIEIEADRVVGPPRPAGSIFGPRAWLGGGVALVVAAALGAWFWRRTIRPPSGAAGGDKVGRRGRGR
ncbi:MAG: hypothetical protein ACLQNE_38875 [Thermoguttaceae bacterium]